MRGAGIAAVAIALLAMPAPPSLADQEEDLAKKTQNPVSDLISVPFENNFNFGAGERDRTQYVLNIQPVVPVHLTHDWLLINRTIMPLVYQPAGVGGSNGEFGLSDINHTAWLSPQNDSPILWGLGPVVSLPTAVNDRLGPSKLSVGPSFVLVTTPGDFVAGFLVNNVWSVAGDSDTPNVNAFTLQYFINYNLADGWYLNTGPVLTANWNAKSGDQWTIPVGAGIGKIHRFGQLPLNLRLAAFSNVERPSGAADWSLQFRIQFLFPKGSRATDESAAAQEE